MLETTAPPAKSRPVGSAFDSDIEISPAVAGSFSWSSASLTFTPATRLPLRTRFQVSVGPGVRDVAGNASTTSAPPFSFTTVGNPSVVASDPAASATGLVQDQIGVFAAGRGAGSAGCRPVAGRDEGGPQAVST